MKMVFFLNFSLLLSPSFSFTKQKFSSGWYQFTSLGDGDYVVSFTVDDDLDFFIPYKSVYGFQGWSFSPANAGGDDSVDSDAIVTSDDNRGSSLFLFLCLLLLSSTIVSLSLPLF